MTINLANNSPRIEYSVAQGVTQSVFAIPFEFFDDSDVDAYVDGVLKTQGSHYSLSGGDGSTGTLTFSPAITGATGGSQIVIVRNIAIERTSDFSAGADINRAALNEQLDTLTAMVADLKSKVDRSPTLYDYDVVNYQMMIPPTAQRSSKYLAFGATGDLTVANGTTSNIVVSSFGETLIDDPNAATALQTLGLTVTSTQLNAVPTQLDGKQPLDAELTAIAGLAANGIIARTSSSTAAARAVTAGIGISIVNGDGVSGDPTVSADIASQVEAEAGVSSAKVMTPERTRQAITSLSTVLLATLNTTSGNTQTTGTLDLTPYKSLLFDIDGVGDNSATSGTFAVAGIIVGTTGTTASVRFYGSCSIILASGIFTSAVQIATPTTPPQTLSTIANVVGRTAINNASTTISVTMATTTFAAGVVRIYGVR